jgi:hypothetical protein
MTIEVWVIGSLRRARAGVVEEISEDLPGRGVHPWPLGQAWGIAMVATIHDGEREIDGIRRGPASGSAAVERARSGPNVAGHPGIEPSWGVCGA